MRRNLAVQLCFISCADGGNIKMTPAGEHLRGSNTPPGTCACLGRTVTPLAEHPAAWLANPGTLPRELLAMAKRHFSDFKVVGWRHLSSLSCSNAAILCMLSFSKRYVYLTPEYAIHVHDRGATCLRFNSEDCQR
jgi:hypothetical protein